jgi:hypothetical protein
VRRQSRSDGRHVRGSDDQAGERQPGRVGLDPIEWTAIFVGTTVATNLINNLANDLYVKAKQLHRERKAKAESEAWAL